MELNLKKPTSGELRAREFDLLFGVAPLFEPPQDSLLTHSHKKQKSQKCFYSLLACFFLYSLVFFFTRPREPPQRRQMAVFPRVFNGFGRFGCPQRAAMFFSLLARLRRPGGAQMAVFLRVFKGFDDFWGHEAPAMFFSLLACFFFTRLFFLFTRHE